MAPLRRADLGNLQPQLAHRHPARLRLDAGGATRAAGAGQRRSSRCPAVPPWPDPRSPAATPAPRRRSGTSARTRPTQSQRAGLGIRFRALLPQLTPATGLGADAVTGYAARQGVEPAQAFIANLQPILTPEQLAKTVLEVAGDPDSAPEYLVTGAGYRAL